MRAIILAAGRGKRMGKLTEHTPKPLLRVANHYLIEYVITALTQAGIHEIVINVSYHREQIKKALGNGSKYNADIVYSEEPERLETGGGIVKALPLLGDKPFLVISSDIISDYPLQHLPADPASIAHLIMVNNPAFHLKGDFGLEANCVSLHTQPTFTYASIGVYRPELFIGCTPKCFPLAALLLPAISRHQVSGEYYDGMWYNIGSSSILNQVNQLFLQRKQNS